MNAPHLVALDTMNLWIETTPEDLKKVLRKVDVLLVNDSEARLLSGKRSLAHAAAAIRDMGPSRVIVKKGEHGALYFGHESVLAVPAIILDDVVDPTGAGDCFAGGFMGSLAEAGADPGQRRRRVPSGHARRHGDGQFLPGGFQRGGAAPGGR